jgi:hypothetical protein
VKLKNIKARMSLYSALSIIALMLLCTAAWNMLDIAQKTYKKMLTGNKKKHFHKHFDQKKVKKSKIPEESEIIENNKKSLSSEKKIQTQTNPIYQKIMAGLYIAESKLKANNIRSSLQSNERNAVRILQKYAQAQKKYYDHYGHYAKDASDLIIKQDGKYTILDPDLSVLNSALSPEKASQGYFYVEITKPSLKTDKTIAYILNALPAEYGLSGLNTYCVNQGGAVFQKNNGAKAVKDAKFLDQSWQTVNEK